MASIMGTTSKMKTTSKVKMTLKKKMTIKNEDDIKNEDNLKKEDILTNEKIVDDSPFLGHLHSSFLGRAKACAPKSRFFCLSVVRPSVIVSL